jgi:hypothetical protein
MALELFSQQKAPESPALRVCLFVLGGRGELGSLGWLGSSGRRPGVQGKSVSFFPDRKDEAETSKAGGAERRAPLGVRGAVPRGRMLAWR